MSQRKRGVIASASLGIVAITAGLMWVRESGREHVQPTEASNIKQVAPAVNRSFADFPALPDAEPPSDRQLVSKIKDLAEATPAEAAPALKTAVKETRDPAARAVAAAAARRLPAEDAREVYESLAAKPDASPSAFRGLAEAHAKLGRAKEACEAFEKGLSLHPTEYALREDYARYLAVLGRPREAADVCLLYIEEGKDTRSNCIRRCLLAGEILFAAGEKDKARAAWEKILVLAETPEEGEQYVAQIFTRHLMKR